MISQPPAARSVEEGHQWQLAVSLLSNLSANKAHRADTVNTAASACTRGHRWQQALCLFQDAFRAGLRPSPVSMVVILAACATGSLWEPALAWLSKAQTAEVDAATQTACLNSAAASCGRAMQWERSLALLFSCPAVTKDDISFSSAVESCCQGLAWQSACELLETAATQNLNLGLAAQRSVAQRLEQALRRSEALRIQQRLTATLLRKPQMAFSDPESWFCWDLLEASESKAFIGSHFEQLLASPSLRSLPSQLSLPCGLVRGSAENLKLSRQNAEAAPQACLLPHLCRQHTR